MVKAGNNSNNIIDDRKKKKGETAAVLPLLSSVAVTVDDTPVENK